MINIIGEFFGPSGYANHCRYLANELNKLIPCKLTTNIPNGFERLVNDSELEMIKRQSDYETNLIITHPLYWRTNCDAKRNIVYLIWEGNKVPEWIVEECENESIEKIIVPSKHTYDAAWKSGVDPDKITIIPHGVDLKTFYPIDSPSKQALTGGTTPGESAVRVDSPFTFLSNKGFRNLEDRGGVQYLIKAYLEEFSGDDTELIIKINPAYGIPNIEQLFPGISSRKDIKFITDNYTNKQLNELYNSCDVYVSATRAEAFNLPCLEAMACGKPVITTNFGGQTDFVKDGFTGALIDYDLVEVQHELEYEGIKWATPKIEHLRKLLRYAYEDDAFAILGSQGLMDAKQFTWENTAKQISSLLN